MLIDPRTPDHRSLGLAPDALHSKVMDVDCVIFFPMKPIITVVLVLKYISDKYILNQTDSILFFLFFFLSMSLVERVPRILDVL